jgi:hypothetical protein
MRALSLTPEAPLSTAIQKLADAHDTEVTLLFGSIDCGWDHTNTPGAVELLVLGDALAGGLADTLDDRGTSFAKYIQTTPPEMSNATTTDPNTP